MGNCSLKRVECHNTIKLVTDFEGIVEIKSPILVKDVLNGFPIGLGIFRLGDGATCQLGNNELLKGGRGFYYLLPLVDRQPSDENEAEVMDGGGQAVGRLSLSCCRVEQQTKGVEVLPSQRNGVWKVKLVITPKELEEILSEEGNTEALIEKMRMAAAAAPARRSWKPAFFSVFKVSSI